MVATLALTRSMREVCASANVTSRREITARSFTLAWRFLSAVLSNAWPIRWVMSPTSPAMRLACAVSCPMSGRVAPGHASPPSMSDSTSAFRTIGSVGSGSNETMFALHSPKRLADAEMTAGLPGSSTVRSTVSSVSTHSSGARRIASTRPTRTPRRVTGAPTPRPPTVRKRAVYVASFWFTSVSLSHSAPPMTRASAASTDRPTANSLLRFIGTSTPAPGRVIRDGPR